MTKKQFYVMEDPNEGFKPFFMDENEYEEYIEESKNTLMKSEKFLMKWVALSKLDHHRRDWSVITALYVGFKDYKPLLSKSEPRKYLMRIAICQDSNNPERPDVMIMWME